MMLYKYNRFFVNFDLGHKNNFKKNLKIFNISRVILEEYIKFEKSMAGNVIKEYVNVVKFASLTRNNIKDLRSLYSFPKVTESVLNTNNFSAYRILIIIELGLILVLFLYTKEYKTNKTGLCKISKPDYENKKAILIFLGLAIENVFLGLKKQAFKSYTQVNFKDIFSAEGALNIRFFPHLVVPKTPLQTGIVKVLFLLVCIRIFTLILGEYAAKPKKLTNFIIKNSDKYLTMQKRGMLSRTSGTRTTFKLTSNVKSSTLIFQETKKMSEFVRGVWATDSIHYAETTFKGITHQTMLSTKIFSQLGHQQLNNAITSNPNCYKHDNSVIAVTPLALSLLDNSKPHKGESLAWKGTYVTAYEAWTNFIITTPSLPENDFNLLRTFENIKNGAFYIRPGYENIEFFRTMRLNELYSILLKITVDFFPLPSNNIKQLYFPESSMTLIQHSEPKPVVAKPEIIDLPPSEYKETSQPVIFVQPNLTDVKESEKSLTEQIEYAKTQALPFNVEVTYTLSIEKNTELAEMISNIQNSTGKSKKAIKDVLKSSSNQKNIVEIYTQDIKKHDTMIKNFYKEKNEKNKKNNDEDVSH